MIYVVRIERNQVSFVVQNKQFIIRLLIVVGITRVTTLGTIPKTLVTVALGLWLACNLVRSI